MGSIFAQERYTVPELTYKQKHIRVLSETYGFVTTGINFAKSQGVSPYDYGIYVGNIYASYWNPEIGFEGFVKNVIRTWESLRTDQDAKIMITEKSDNTVSMEFPKNEMTKFLGGENPIATTEEVVEYFKGLLKPITAKFKSSATIDITDTYITFIFKKN
jgi:hypothetical protein